MKHSIALNLYNVINRLRLRSNASQKEIEILNDIADRLILKELSE